MTPRRSFLKGILAACVAPAFVPVERLMRIRPIVLPEEVSITAGYMDGRIAYRFYVLHVDGKETLLRQATTDCGGWVELSEPYTTLAGDLLCVSWTET